MHTYGYKDPCHRVLRVFMEPKTLFYGHNFALVYRYIMK